MTKVYDVLYSLFAVSIISVIGVVSLDFVQQYRAWPAEYACHAAHLVPTRRPLSATVACLPSVEIPR